MVNQFKGSKELPPQFTRRYGLIFGYNERKAMSMALVDRAFRAKEYGEEVEGAAQDEEFVLYHFDNVEAQGFVQHLKLPHYIDFQAELNLIRRMRKEQKINSLEIRAEEANDYSAIAKVNNLAFKQENEAKLVEKIRKSDRYIPELSLVAELDNKIVGHIMFSYIDLVDKKTTKVLALAPVAVLPEYQNQGIGSLSIETGLEIAGKRQAPMVIVLGDPSFYIRFGFKPASDYGIQSPFDVSDEYFMVKFLTKYSDLQGKIVYPAAFSAV